MVGGRNGGGNPLGGMANGTPGAGGLATVGGNGPSGLAQLDDSGGYVTNAVPSG